MLSGALFASAHAGEKTKDVIQHFLLAFSTLGILQTDNGPAYTSKNFKQFLDWWGGKHTTGIPHSPAGQSIVERAHCTLRRVLDQQHGGVETLLNVERLCKALYVINFLNNSVIEPNPPTVRQFFKHAQIPAH